MDDNIRYIGAEAAAHRKTALLPLRLAAFPQELPDYSEADAEFPHVRLKALERDSRTCRFCGFRAPRFQEIHHLNGDHRDYRLENLVTACTLCHAVSHLEAASSRQDGSVMIWLPEISQTELHHAVRTAHMAVLWAQDIERDRRLRAEVVRWAGEIGAAGSDLLAAFHARSEDARRLFGTSDPRAFAAVLSSMTPQDLERQDHTLPGLRLLRSPLVSLTHAPAPDVRQIYKSWTETGGPYSQITPRIWRSILTQDWEASQ